jgi:hypothetical protein
MEFLKSNYLDTTTAITLTGGGSLTAGYLFFRDTTFQYITDSAGTDATTASIKISFDNTQTVGRIALLGHNLKSFTIFYNGLTANTFALTSTCNCTATSNWSNNSTTAMFMRVTPVACTSVTIDMKTTISGNTEKAIGYLFVSDILLDFPVDPPADGYKPILNPIGVQHKLSTGGVRVHKTGDKWSTQITLKYITSSFVDSLRSVYDNYPSFSFCPFGTATSWTDQILYECCWTSPFEFYKYADNAAAAGFTGKFEIDEI